MSHKCPWSRDQKPRPGVCQHHWRHRRAISQADFNLVNRNVSPLSIRRGVFKEREYNTKEQRARCERAAAACLGGLLILVGIHLMDGKTQSPIAYRPPEKNSATPRRIAKSTTRTRCAIIPPTPRDCGVATPDMLPPIRVERRPFTCCIRDFDWAAAFSPRASCLARLGLTFGIPVVVIRAYDSARES